MMTALEEELITENERLTQQVKQLLLELKQERDYSNDLAMRLNDWKATDEKRNQRAAAEHQERITRAL